MTRRAPALGYHDGMARPAVTVFLSYAHRYREWVRVLRDNLLACFEAAGRPGEVFLDDADLGAGRSWVRQLQAGLDRADHLLLIATPEAMASPRVADEWQSFVAERRRWRQGELVLAHLVDTPLPLFLADVQEVDFRGHDEAGYRRALSRLAGAFLGREPERLPAGVDVPEPPFEGLPAALRGNLFDWLEPLLERQANRRAVAAALGLDRKALDDHPSRRCACSAALVEASGDDDAVAAALRFLEVVEDELGEDEAEKMAALGPLREELGALGQGRGLLGRWLERTAQEHSRLVAYFQERAELELLDQVYVKLELQPGRPRGTKDDAEPRLEHTLGLEEVLRLDPGEHPWITRRWVVLGDPGSGKTTLLRHLASTLARRPDPAWVPVFESLPRLMLEREPLLDRLERRMRRAGHRGLAAILDREGERGRLLLLLDGLDEVRQEDRAEVEALLGDFSRRWPETPMVVASRPIGYRSPGAEFRELELLPLDRRRRRQFLSRWFGRRSGEPDPERAEAALAVLDGERNLRELAGNPLYLTLMALLLEQGGSPAPRRTRLYDQVFDLLLEGAHRDPPTPMPQQQATRRMLRHLAHEMTRENRDAEPIAALEARLYQPQADPLREPLERHPRWRRSLRPFLDDLAERTGILGPHDGPGADWRFWHRTFREALTAEHLERLHRREGPEAVLAHARGIAGDESRWAEPYALLAGRVKEPDALVKALVKENRALGLRALATAQGLTDETVTEILELTGNWQERAKVYERVPELIDDSEGALALLDRLRRRTRNGNDLYFLDLAAAAAGDKWPEERDLADHLRARLYDHVPPPPADLFRWIETPAGGRVELWRKIPAGEFLIGSPEEEKGDGDERPRHPVEITAGFRLGAVPVTNAQYAAFDPDHEPKRWEGVDAEELPHHPVVTVTWYAAVSFCRWLSGTVEGTAGARLPGDEEWEYACRAGTETRYWSGDEESDLDRVGWYNENSSMRTHRVGEKAANPWGLYDVHGNVQEWTLGLQETVLARDAGVTVDPGNVRPEHKAGGATRVIRGGGYWDDARGVRSAYRDWVEPRGSWNGLGFRVLLPPPRDV